LLIQNLADEPSTPPTKELIKEIIHTLPRNKATGPDQMCIEMLQAAGPVGLDMTAALLTRIWETQDVPEEMGEAWICLLPKDPKHPKDPTK